jgi:hypothetical protein
MCIDTTYRSAGAEISVGMATIDILLRWSKDRVLAVALELGFVQLNLCDNQFLISTSRFKYLNRTHVTAARSKICASLNTTILAEFFAKCLEITAQNRA